MSELISLELRAALRRLKLSPMTETLPERLRLARERAMPYQDFLELVMAEECERRNHIAASRRAQKARLDTALNLAKPAASNRQGRNPPPGARV